MDINRQYKLMKLKQVATITVMILMIAGAMVYDFRNRIEKNRSKMFIEIKDDIVYNNGIKQKER